MRGFEINGHYKTGIIYDPCLHISKKDVSIRKSFSAREVIEKCYPSDPALTEQFHVLAPTDTDTAINHTSEVLQQSIDMGILCLYELYVNNEFAGYFGRETIRDTEMLTGMFIMPQYRNKQFVERFWSLVRSKFKRSIFTYLYEKNTRAITFIKRKGFRYFDKAYVDKEKQYAHIYRYN